MDKKIQKNFIQYNLSPKTKDNLPQYIKEDYFFLKKFSIRAENLSPTLLSKVEGENSQTITKNGGIKCN